ncbi:hypothetical protein IB243_07915 [Acidovorax sp. ACV01]|nr:hypothetical protein [Acidovorax sp. ACV01]
MNGTAMSTTPIFRTTLRSLAVTVAALVFTSSALAADVLQGIEKLLADAQQQRHSVTLYVGGQSVGGAVTRLEPGQWVELRNQQFGRILVRLDRIDAVATQ